MREAQIMSKAIRSQLISFALLFLLTFVANSHQDQVNRRSTQFNSQDANSIYINPIPHTRTRSNFRPRASTSEIHADDRHFKPDGFVTPLQLPADQTQLADWPFFKSFQSAQRLNGKNWQPIGRIKIPTARDEHNQASQTVAELRQNQMTNRQVISSSSTSRPGSEETATTEYSMTAQSSTSSPTVTPSPATTTTLMPEVSVSTISSSLDTSTIPSYPASRQELSSMGPLFSPETHSSIQNSVGSIVDWVKDSGSSILDKPNITETISVKEAEPSKSSLSLNVLLRNFGVQHLSDLDKILLRSSHNKQDESSTNKMNPNEQQIHISGILAAGSNAGQASNNASIDQMAECKIEYTRKYVNITLMKENQGDYACDYVIDRKSAGDSSSESQPSDRDSRQVGAAIRKVCQLELTSRFFSNQTDSSMNNPQTQCNGTFLLVGGLKFCYFSKTSNMKSDPLKRIFEFPFEQESFEIKMVHRKREFEVEEANPSPEIHLEIKPVFGNSDRCRNNSSSPIQIRPLIGKPIVETSRQVERELKNQKQTLASPSILTTETPDYLESHSTRPPNLTEPQSYASNLPGDQNPPELAVTLKPASDGASDQSHGTIRFDPTLKITPKLYVGSNYLCNGRPAEFHNLNGQIASPNYPGAYGGNLNCSYVIRPASPSHCHILLQLRDFNLRREATISRDRCDDDDDYLQIGSQKLCDNHSLIGHKLKLDFGPTRKVQLIFRSSDIVRASGLKSRGFLIKFQQLSCIGDKSPLRDFRPLRPKSSDEPGQQKSGIQAHSPPRLTLKPPSEEPDFMLAIKKSNPKVQSNSTNPTTSSTTTSTTSTIVKPRLEMPDSTITRTNSSQMLSMASTISSSSSHPSRGLDPLSPFTSISQRPDMSDLSRVEMQSSDNKQSCKYVHSEMNFYLSSPNYPNRYTNDLECFYYIRRNNTKICYIELTLLKFDLEPNTDCRFDFLEINTVRLCGSLQDNEAHKTSRIYQFNESVKVIRFKTDGRETRTGFLARVEQLECGSSGSIIRKELTAAEPETPTSHRDSSRYPGYRRDEQIQHSSHHSNSTDRIEYDTQTVSKTNQSWSSQSADDQPLLALTPRTSSISKASTCDVLIPGSRETTIRSPLWPESYLNDDSINTCRYVIQIAHLFEPHQHQQPRKTCQLEIRFVHLRLGPTDCLDLDGQELLCGFEGRNLVKYYQFDRKSKFVITLFVGVAAKTSRSNNHQLEDPFESQVIKPYRFMLVAKQLDCIDGFLAPDDPTALLKRRLLYSQPTFTRPTASPSQTQSTVSEPKQHVTSRASNESSVIKYDDSLFDVKKQIDTKPAIKLRQETQPRTNITTNGLMGESQCLDGSIVETEGLGSHLLSSLNYPNRYKPNSHCVWSIMRHSERFCHLELEFLALDLESTSQSDLCESDYIQVNYGERYCTTSQLNRRLDPSKRLIVPLDQSHDFRATLVFHSDSSLSGSGFLIRYKQRECSGIIEPQISIPRPDFDSDSMKNSKDKKAQCSHTLTSQFNGILSSSIIKARMRSSSIWASECHLRLKLLPSFCQIQLSFGDQFDLASRRPIDLSCSGESLELAGSEYCGQELKNVNLTLGISNMEQRTVDLVYRYPLNESGHSAGFRAVFKQLECNLNTHLDRLPANKDQPSSQRGETSIRPKTSADSERQLHQSGSSAGSNQVRFEEINIRGEFFELDSSKLANNSDKYPSNVFIAYRIKRLNDQVCKLRLMFYRFELESSAGCKRDFLDVNNVDRLCGQIGSSEDARRDYDWPQTGRDFLVSFVSDSEKQSSGFHLFGQQLQSGCGPEKSISGSSTVIDKASTTKAPSIGSREMNEREESPRISEKQSDLSKGVTASCNELHYETHFELSSPNWPNRYEARRQCHYLIHRNSSQICSVTFRVNSLILGPDRNQAECEPQTSDSLQIGDQHIICGLLTEPKSVTISFESHSFVTLKFSSPVGSGFGFHIEARQNNCDDQATIKQSVNKESQELDEKAEANQKSKDDEEGCAKLLLDQQNQLESPNFGQSQQYPANSDCLYAVRRSNSSICAIDLIVRHFDLTDADPFTGQCEGDFLEIDHSRFCGFYPAKHRIRFSYIGDELDKLIRFRSDGAHERSGFSLIIRKVDECKQQLEQTTTESPSLTKHGVSKQIPLTSHDTIHYLPDSSLSAATLTARDPNTQVRPLNGPATDTMSLYEPDTTLCQFVFNHRRQLLVSPNYHPQRQSYENNIDCLYKIIAVGYDVCSLRLTFIDLDLANTDPSCSGDYLLIDQRRYCSMPRNRSRSLEISFPDLLPREIHLNFHTDSHSNSGRGFKMSYEQVSCDEPAMSITRGSNGELAAQTDDQLRQLRLNKFGQLSYPKNYVSSQAANRVVMSTQLDLDEHQASASKSTNNQSSDKSSDTLTLRKEISVVSNTPDN